MTPKHVIVMVKFLIVDSHVTYNAIIGWKTLNNLMVVTSTDHIKVKFSTEVAIEEIKGD